MVEAIIQLKNMQCQTMLILCLFSSTVGLIIPLARDVPCISFIAAARLLGFAVSAVWLPGKAVDLCMEFVLVSDDITTSCIGDISCTSALLEP